MPTPIITLPIHTIEQARALAGLLRAFIDGQQPDTNEGADWEPDPDLAGMAALFAHLDAGIANPSAAPVGRLVTCGRITVCNNHPQEFQDDLDFETVDGVLITMDVSNVRAAAGAMLGRDVLLRAIE